MPPSLVLPQDTPIKRVCLADMTPEQIEEHVEYFRTRRMAAYTAYQEAQRLRAEAKSRADALQMQKRLDQLEKVFKTLDNSLDKATRYAAEIKVLAMTAGA